jgi:hypothetical protein
MKLVKLRVQMRRKPPTVVKLMMKRSLTATMAKRRRVGSSGVSNPSSSDRPTG